MANETIGQISTDSERGATVTTTYARRTMRAFAVYELEMEQLASTNSTATFFFTSAGVALGYVADSLPKALSTAGSSMKEPISFLIIAGFCIVVGVWNWRKRRTILDTIRGQSQTEPPTASGGG